MSSLISWMIARFSGSRSEEVAAGVASEAVAVMPAEAGFSSHSRSSSTTPGREVAMLPGAVDAPMVETGNLIVLTVNILLRSCSFHCPTITVH